MDSAVAKEMSGNADVDWSEQSGAHNLQDADRDSEETVIKRRG